MVSALLRAFLPRAKWPLLQIRHSRHRFWPSVLAAKEAAAKALGTGFRDGLNLHDIGVDNDALGKPLLVFSQRAQQILQKQGIGNSHLSLSDEKEYAIAYVVLETVNNKKC